MANVKINLNVTSNRTIANEAEQAERLGDNLERSNRAASVANKLRGAESDATRGYRQFRGTTGTGAEARDFSKQAAGLGGLVHVYATFAANIFALTSAFTALSKAMDTTNMIAGLEQLGAASGKNLSGLTKQLIAASDGAISLKDALTATAQASAGGLTGEQLIRLTTVAKQASQALGRDMPDALSRLTRGITKIEPELLDELGILVKVEKANVDYARSLGKTASSLTDLEKRQAFATAAITQGEQKFKDIQLASNPYQKILASTQDLTQSTLELVNVALVPLVNLLAASPTGLALTIGGIAGLLLKQAIPALGQWRAGLEQSAITARKASVDINEAFKQFQADNINRNSNAIAQRIQQQKTVLDASVASLKDAATKGVKSVNSEISKIVSQPISDITDKQIAKIASTEKSFRTKAANLMATPIVGPPIDPKIAAEHNKQADALLKQADALKQLRQQIPLAQADSTAFVNAQKKAQEELAKSQGAFSEASQRQRIADRAERKAAQAEILSNVGRNTQIMGVRGAFTSLRNDIKLGQAAVEQIGKVGEAGYVAAVAARKPLEGLAAAGTLVRGSFAIATSAVSTFLAAFGPWAAVIGIAVIAGNALIGMLSSNTKQLEEFKASVITTEGTVKLLSDTLESISKKPVLEQISAESIASRASAFNELAASVQKLADNLSKTDKAASGFDKFIDQFKKLWGGDLRSQATKGLSAAISSAVTSATGESKDILEASLSNILKTADLTATGITAALEQIPLEDFVARQGLVSDAIAKANSGLQKQTDALTSVKNTLDEVSKTASTLIVGLTAQDSFGKFAVSVVNASNSIAKALENPTDALTVLMTLAGDVGRLSALSGDMAAELIGSTSELEKQVESIKAAGQAVDLYSQAIAAAQETINKSTANSFYDVQALAKAQDSIKGLKLGKQEAIKIQQEVQLTVQPSTLNLLKRVVEDSFKNGANLIQVAMQNAQEAASITVAKAAASGLSGPGTADVNFGIRSREIALAEQQLKAELGLLTAQNENKSALEKLTNVVALDTQVRIKQSAEADLKAGTGNREELTRIVKNSEESIKTTNKAIELGNAITRNLQSLKGLSPKQASSQLTSMISESTDTQGRAALQATQTQLLGAVQKQIANEAEREVAALNRSLEIIKEKAAVAQKDKDAKLQSLDLDLKAVEATQNVLGYYDKSLQDRKQALVIDKQNTQNLKDRLVYESTIADLNTRATAGISTSSQIQQVNAERAKQVAASRIKDEQELSALTVDRLTREEKERKRLVELSNIDFQNQKSTAQANLDFAETELSIKNTLGNISESNAAKEDASNVRARLALENEAAIRERSQEFESRMADIRLQSEVALANAKQGKDTGQVAALEKQQSEITAQYVSQIFTLNQINALKAVGISLTEAMAVKIGQENEQLDKQASLLKTIENTSVSLSAAFGKVGTSIGNIAKSLQKSATEQVSIEKKKSQDIAKVTKNGQTDPKEKAKIEKKYALETASIQIGTAADIAGAVADSFDEQSSAAAAFHKIEKAFHIAKLAMDVQSLASTWATVIGEEIAASQTALAWIPAVWARAFGEGGPYAGWALGAAAIAMIGLGGGKGGKSGPTSKQKQEVQGTGQMYDQDGNLVDTGFTGVLGDRTAKSESIANSLELLAEYSFEELEYSNKMLTALKDIASSLSGVSKSLVLTSGIISGSAFGTSEGATKSLLGSVFGGNKSTTITGTGLNIKGSVASLAQKAGTIQQYENVTQTKSGGLFGLLGGSTKNITNTTNLSGQIVDSISLVFDNIKKSLVEVGKTLGLGAEELGNKISQIPIDLSIELRDLKGKELEEAVSSVLSATLDNITEQALAIVKPFQKMGEGLAETALRVANDSRVIDLQLKSIGIAFGTGGLQPVITAVTKTVDQIVGYTYDEFSDYTGRIRNGLVPITESITTTEYVTVQKTAMEAKQALIELSGGLEEFVSKSDFFRDNFLTEAQKLAPVQKAVTEELARLGKSSIDTREEFSALVLSLDLSKEADQQLYVSLMNLAKGFATVYEETESLTLSVKDLADAQLSQEIKVLELLGDKTKALNLTRDKELKGLDARLKPMQQWIYALEDEADARSALASAYDTEVQARQTSIDKLKSSRDALLDFSKTIALGQTSPLTPEQKYKEAKSNLKALTDVLNNTTSTAEDRSKALEKLPNAISSLLDTSKVFNASSQAFQQDYALSQSLLKSNADKLGEQLTFEERSLKELTNQVEKLGVINTSIKDTNSLIIKLTDAITKSQSAATGVGPKANEAIVKSIYNTNPILSPSDTAGQNFWIDRLNSGASTIAQVQDAISKTTLVRSWYRNALGREGEQAGIDFWVDRLNKANDVKKVKAEFAIGAAAENKRPVMSIDAFANGGYMNGMAVVGEVGKEIVDFDNPGRVYSANDSKGLMDGFGKAVADELGKLRTQVASLQADANKNAALLARVIATSNKDASDKVSTTIENTSSINTFQGRNTATLS